MLNQLPESLKQSKKTDWVVLAGGPSVTNEHVRLVHDWKNADDANRGVIAVTKSYLIAPWADIVHARDKRFWDHLYNDIVSKTDAIKTSYQANPNCPPDVSLLSIPKSKEGNNSGFQAMLLAMALGAKNIYLLGIDMKYIRDKTHWHKGYSGPIGNSSAQRETMGGIFRRWMRNFEKIDYSGVNVINCSMNSGLNLFPKKPAEEVLK